MNLMRKFSFRQNNNLAIPKSNEIKKSLSTKSLWRPTSSREKIDEVPELEMPMDVVCAVVDQMTFFEQIAMSRVCKKVASHVEAKFAKVRRIELRKEDVDQATIDGIWDRHQRAHVAVSFRDDTVIVVVDAQWTALDITVTLGIINVFHKSVRHVFIDAPLAEAVIVSLSELDLDRWYAFQCFLKGIDESVNVHMGCEYAHLTEIYWPNVEELTVRTTAKQASHLARLMDYGVKSNGVVDRRKLCKLHIVLCDVECVDRQVNRQLYHFRCWAGSMAWDDRYEQSHCYTSNRQAV